ncbi:Methyltransferase [uncultured Candidatus Thioglobus sp.]|nr:Methyltransferase [uncultured Candidatus Thioglobus sp.]
MIMLDKNIEKNRYNNAAQNALDKHDLLSVNNLTLPLKTPYTFYQSAIASRVDSDSLILEIGAGMGENTEFLLATGARVCATDISQKSLSVIEKRFNTNKLTTKVADMEKLPFADESFDTVVSAGSLSYGDNDVVLDEIYRVLKSGGTFIAVDSLNNSPVYRLNRFIHYLRGYRSLSTLQRMPTLKLLGKYRLKFSKIETRFFGSISYLVPFMVRVFGERISTKISDSVDKMFVIKKSAFKFVLIAEK